MAVVPAVHRERDEVRAFLDVADDDAAFFPGLPPDGRAAQRTPAALVRRGPQEPAATESVQRAMKAPGRVHEPRRGDLRRSGYRIPHGATSLRGALLSNQRHPVDDHAAAVQHDRYQHESCGSRSFDSPDMARLLCPQGSPYAGCPPASRRTHMGRRIGRHVRATRLTRCGASSTSSRRSLTPTSDHEECERS